MTSLELFVKPRRRLIGGEDIHNLPYVFDSFRYQGYIGDDLTPHLLKNHQPREDELPLDQSLVDFGASRGR